MDFIADWRGALYVIPDHHPVQCVTLTMCHLALIFLQYIVDLSLQCSAVPGTLSFGHY